MKPKATIIFDLDGTLADTLVVALEIANDLEILDKPLTLGEVEHLKSMPVKEILRELGIPLRHLPKLLVKGRAALTHRISEIPLHAGMEAVIKQLHDDGFELFVMSSNSLNNVRQFLENHKIDQYFKDIHGGVGVFGKAKSLKNFLKHTNADLERTYYVGDEIRDIEAAKKVGIKPVSVAWGFNSDVLLKSYHPYGIAHTAEELVSILAASQV